MKRTESRRVHVAERGRDGALRRPRICMCRSMAFRGRRSAASLPLVFSLEGRGLDLLSAKGARSYQLAAARFCSDDEQALKARFNPPLRRQSTQVGVGMNRAFSAGGMALHEPLGRCPSTCLASVSADTSAALFLVPKLHVPNAPRMKREYGSAEARPSKLQLSQ